MQATQVESIAPMLSAANESSQKLRLLSDEKRQDLLNALADALDKHVAKIVLENEKDLVRMDDANPKKDRLLLNEDRIYSLADSVRDVAKLADPCNHVLYEHELKNGLQVQKISTAIGVVGIIYESRPNVTIDVAALCLRSGNACVLRGGSDAFYTNLCLVDIVAEVLQQYRLPSECVTLLPVERKFVGEMLAAEQYIDIIIPRGSQQLIEFVRSNSRVPTIETGAGVCHTYVTESAHLKNARDIVVNAKTSRPSVCNALDTVLVDAQVAEAFLPTILEGFTPYEVEIFADEQAYAILLPTQYPYLREASEEDFGREFLDYKCSIKVVHSYEEAIRHINKHSSKHSEAIISEDEALCERFLNEVDAAAVYANASTRFTDGGVFGLGAEIGISTQKLHARGPFALEKLTTEKWVVRGDGQIR